jgi:hypothetical protein
LSDATCQPTSDLPAIPAELDLAARQRLLLAVLKDRLLPGSPEARMAERLFGRSELGLLREVSLWWRRLSILRSCRFTPALLERQGRLDTAIRDFVRSSPGSEFVERQGELFLIHAMADSSPLVRALAATEMALLRVLRDPATPDDVIFWPAEPGAVFAGLANGLKFDLDALQGEYRVTVGRNQPGGIAWCRA